MLEQCCAFHDVLFFKCLNASKNSLTNVPQMEQNMSHEILGIFEKKKITGVTILFRYFQCSVNVR